MRYTVKDFFLPISSGCSDCGNKMLFKFHPGAFGLTAKNHWSCCGGARDATGCSMCSKVPEQDQPEPQPEPQPPDKPSIKLPEKQPEKQRKEIVTLTSSSSTREDPKPEPHVMYLNPLTEPPTTETKVNAKPQQYIMSTDLENTR